MLRTSPANPELKLPSDANAPNDDNLPNDTKLPNDHSVKALPSRAHDLADAVAIPDWVCILLNASPEDVEQVIIDSVTISGPGRSGRTRGDKHLYLVLIEYFAYHAVNVDESVKKVDESAAADPKSNARRLLGRLSTLIYAFNYIMFPFDDASSDSSESDSEGAEKEREPPKAVFHFGIGTARIQINGKEVCISHQNVGPPLPLDTRTGRHREMRLFARSAVTIKELSDAALKWDFERNKRVRARSGKYQLYTLIVQHGDAYWNNEGHKASRSLDSVILPKGMLRDIVDDFKEFSAADTEEWYVAHGLPYRRSYLFYGPPGVGKTSTIRALAGALELSACFLSLGDCNIGNSELQTALRNIPDAAMLVIEDIDALFNEDRKTENPSALTFSGLLNSLDGLVSKDGILTVMTTNHIEKLDPALVRAGRVDRRFQFKPPTHEQIKGLFASFYPGADKGLCQEFADAVFERKEKDARSIATLQEHFIFTRRKGARESVDALDDFFTRFYPDGNKADGMSFYA